jgi:hypothetical protein
MYGQQPGYSQSMGANDNFGAASAQVRGLLAVDLGWKSVDCVVEI